MLIWNLGWWILCEHPILDPKFSQYLRERDGKRRSQKLHPTFKIGSNIQRANELLIKCILKVGSNPWFCPSLRTLWHWGGSLHCQVEHDLRQKKSTFGKLHHQNGSKVYQKNFMSRCT